MEKQAAPSQVALECALATVFQVARGSHQVCSRSSIEQRGSVGILLGEAYRAEMPDPLRGLPGAIELACVGVSCVGVVCVGVACAEDGEVWRRLSRTIDSVEILPLSKYHYRLSVMRM